MPNIPGAPGALPGVYTLIETLSNGVSIPGGTRIAAIMGEGIRDELIVATAVGGGNDGLNPQFTSTTGSDGRHFITSTFPIVANRFDLFKNGIRLNGIEQSITPNSTFSSSFDYRVDISNGRIELQTAQLVDQGGEFFTPGSLNVGTGTINSLSLIDPNAPTESWTIRCVSVRRDGYGNPIDGYARFIAQGSVSGIILDGYGQNIVWQSNGVTINNTILSFNITEGAIPFVEGDRFTIEVRGGALLAGDSLSAQYIATLDINDPTFFTSFDALSLRYGQPSLTNRLSLGAQLAFANEPPGVLAVQCAPSVPRRVSYPLVESATGGMTEDDLTFNLPAGVVPDADAGINFFITDPVTGIETQIIPNKVPFYDPSITASPTTFIFGATFVFSYTVIIGDAVVKAGTDGVLTSIGPTSATLSSVTVPFGSDDLSSTRSLRIINPANPINSGTFPIAAVNNGVLTISNAGGFITESGVEFEIIDSADQSARILWTDDLALGAGSSLRATVVDTKDADFFDVNWESAYSALERFELDMVVPLPSQTISSIFQAGFQHVRRMSDILNRRERVLMIGAISGLTPANLIGTQPAAVEDIGILEGIQGDDPLEILNGNIEDLTNFSVQDAFGSTFRVFYFWPDQIVVQAGADRVLADGFFQAAAAAGFYSGTAFIATPLTNKTLAGFTILRDKQLDPTTLQNLANAGVTVLQPVQGGGLVIWSRTTTNSGEAAEEEQSVVFIRDRIAKDFRSGFQGFIGNVDGPTIRSSLFQRADAILKSFLTQRLITQFRSLEVKRDEVDPRQWNISVQVQPVFPVNYIFIRTQVGVLDG